MTKLPRNTILAGDVLERLAELPTASIDCVITSPPYFQLRDYGVTGQLGLEPTVDGWVSSLRRVCRELARVVKPAGSLWLNLGDSLSRHARYGAPPKGLLLGPERLLIALAADGWIVRNKVVWAKSNPMPTSVADRLTLTYEVVYFLVRSRRYYFDLDAVREPFTSTGTKPARKSSDDESWRAPLAGSRRGLSRARSDQLRHPLGKNPGDVWRIATRGFRGAHFATFPPELLRRPLLATCPERVCTQCQSPWRRAVVIQPVGGTAPTHQLGQFETCACQAPTRPGLVLDPFFGTGTVGVVARANGRDWLGIELSPAYIELARHRLGLASTEAA